MLAASNLQTDTIHLIRYIWCLPPAAIRTQLHPCCVNRHSLSSTTDQYWLMTRDQSNWCIVCSTSRDQSCWCTQLVVVTWHYLLRFRLLLQLF